jgi:hypothetical protein
MRIKIAKILAVLTVASFPQFILAILSILFFPSLWWVGYVVAFVVACVTHDPVTKWVEENIPR